MHFKLTFKKKFQKKTKNKTFYLSTFFKNKNKLESCLRDKNCQISITTFTLSFKTKFEIKFNLK